MPEYDFSTLSPYDFEILSRDLLQKEWSIRLESFKSGRDGGIDLRYSKPENGSEIIVQCKHYQRSGFSNLKSALKSDELPKIKKLKPARYVVTTSVALSPNQKDELVAILHPYCLSPADVLGREDLNNLLGRHDGVERQHFKLWLPSTEVLQRLLHNGIFTQSALEIDEIKRHMSMFVHTDAVDRGMEMLQKVGVCLLTGIPGIGKTTTARILAAHHIQNDWDAFYLPSRAREAFDVYHKDKKQIFFYDDFLGQTSLEEKLPKNEDRDLRQLIRDCRGRPETKRFILTTREYLFEQAKQQHEVLSRSNIDNAECTVQLGDYTKKIRAKILVNHLYFYGVDPDVCSQFVKSGIAKKTLDHKNYNPRIIETMCERQPDLSLEPKEFGEHFIEMLDSPEEIWEHAYHNQLSPNSRQLLLVFAILGDRVTVAALTDQFRIYSQHTTIGLIGFEAMFRRCLEELEGNFLTVHPHPSLAHVTYHNPAVKDFTDRELNAERHILSVALRHFTIAEPLIGVAERLVRQRVDDISGAEILAAIRRGEERTSFQASRLDRTFWKVPQLQRVLALRRWISVVERLDDTHTTKQTIEYVEAFLRDSDASQNSIEYLIDLFYKHQSLSSLSELNTSISIREFADCFMENCREPDDFVAMHSLIYDPDDPDASDSLCSQLHDHFTSEMDDWLSQSVVAAESYELIYEAIDTVDHAAEELGCYGVDTDEAIAEAERLAAREEEEARMYGGDWLPRRHAERLDAESVDDILDSLGD